MDDDSRDRLAGLLAQEPLMARDLPPFDTDDVPADPVELFARWLVLARRSGVLDAHAVTLSTVDADGMPDARVVALRDVDARAGDWIVATSAASPKGVQLAGRPAAAMTLFWPAQGRQVRVRGPVAQAPARASAADFAARPDPSKVAALVGNQSRPLPSASAYTAAESAARARLAADPALVPPEHRLYALHATEVEFWQGAADRRHVRLRYARPAGAGAWERSLLWP